MEASVVVVVVSGTVVVVVVVSGTVVVVVVVVVSGTVVVVVVVVALSLADASAPSSSLEHAAVITAITATATANFDRIAMLSSLFRYLHTGPYDGLAPTTCR
jgi:hypothetical protein